MGWGSTLASALGGAAEGAMQGYQLHETLRLKEKEIDADERMNQLKQEIAQMVASTRADATVTSARIRADSNERMSAAKNAVTERLAELNRDLELSKVDLEGNWEQKKQELIGSQKLNELEKEGLNRLTLQDRINLGRKFEAEEATRRATGVANIQGGTARDVANIQGGTARDVANINQTFGGTTVDGMPGREYWLRTGREAAKRPRSPFIFGPGAGLGGDITQPDFGPSQGIEQQLQGTPLPRTSFRPSVPGLATPAPTAPSLQDLDPDVPDQPDWTPSLDQGAAAGAPDERGEIVNLLNYLGDLMREFDASVDPAKRKELQDQMRQLREQVKMQTGR